MFVHSLFRNVRRIYVKVFVKVSQGHRLRNFVLKFLVEVFISQYLLNMLMDQVDTLCVSRYWSEVLCSTIMTHRGQCHGLRNFVFKFLVKVKSVSLELLNL